MSRTEEVYAQIEKECLAIFGFKRFTQYLLGNPQVIVETDHKPLEIIFEKTISSAPKRLQLMMFRLRRFSFRVVYKPGRSIPIADMLSRAPVECCGSGVDKDSFDIFFITTDDNPLSYLTVTDDRIKQAQEDGAKDEVTRKLVAVIKRGWQALYKRLEEFWSVNDQLSMEEGVVTQGQSDIHTT